MKIRFIGALGSVTGSCTLFAHRGRYYLVDCGAQQGTDAVDGEATVLPFKPRGIQAVLLTHAHLDHCGMLPELIHQGFMGEIYCTRATADLTRLALAGRQEKLEKMVQSFCEKGPNAISLDEIIDQVNLAKFHLASARGAESGGT